MILWLIAIHFGASICLSQEPSGLKLAYFDVDATPSIGSPLPYSATQSIVEPLRCRGIVLLGSGQPIVMCSVDWLGIGNESNLVFR